MTTYSPDAIPAVLQTDSYIRAVLQRCDPSSDPTFEEAVKARLDRQRVFARPQRPTLEFYIHEYALTRAVGNTCVMHEQLLQLLIASSIPDCQILVVPASTEIRRPDFSIFRLDQFEPVVHVDAVTASLFLEQEAEISFYGEFVEHLTTTALDHAESRKLLARTTNELELALSFAMKQVHI